MRKLFTAKPCHEALYPLLFDAASDELAFGASAAGTSRDVLFLQEISIVPEHRGRGLAGRVLGEVAHHYSHLWAVIVVRAAPEEPENDEWTERVYSRPFATSGDAAKKKLRVYWARFGFRPLGKNDFMARDSSADGAPASLRAV